MPERPAAGAWVVGTRAVSRIAYEAVVGATEFLRRRVETAVQAAGPDGLTCDDLEAQLAMRHQTCSPRVYELVAQGRLLDSGFRRRTRTGRTAIVWIVPSCVGQRPDPDVEAAAVVQQEMF